MDPEKNNEPINDEAELDNLINADIEKVKAGNALSPENPEQPKAEDKSEDNPKPETPAEDPSNPPTPADDKEKGYEFRLPNKGKFESDEAYEKRIELLDLVKRRKLADTPEKKAELSEQIKNTKNQIRNLSGAEKFINPTNKDGEPTPEPEDPSIIADRERLKALGGITKDEMEQMIQQDRLVQETKTTLETFVGRHEELKDEDIREVFFDFVDNNYNWQGKTGKDLLTVLELAKEAMFRSSESIEERVIKGANVQEKVNAMQFPGNNGGAPTFSPEMRKSIDELKATGMSEDKAIELLSD